MVGVMVDRGNEMIDMGASLGDGGEDRKGADKGTNELARLIVVGSAVPITFRKWIN